MKYPINNKIGFIGAMTTLAAVLTVSRLSWVGLIKTMKDKSKAID